MLAEEDDREQHRRSPGGRRDRADDRDGAELERLVRQHESQCDDGAEESARLKSNDRPVAHAKRLMKTRVIFSTPISAIRTPAPWATTARALTPRSGHAYDVDCRLFPVGQSRAHAAPAARRASAAETDVGGTDAWAAPY
jgi:hypothetical protein